MRGVSAARCRPCYRVGPLLLPRPACPTGAQHQRHATTTRRSGRRLRAGHTDAGAVRGPRSGGKRLLVSQGRLASQAHPPVAAPQQLARHVRLTGALEEAAPLTHSPTLSKALPLPRSLTQSLAHSPACALNRSHTQLKLSGEERKLQIPKEVIDRLKMTVFGFDTMWVTSVDNYQADGVVFKGNVRAKDPAVAYAKMRDRLKVCFGSCVRWGGGSVKGV